MRVPVPQLFKEQQEGSMARKNEEGQRRRAPEGKVESRSCSTW